MVCSFQAAASGEIKHSVFLLLNCENLFILLPETHDISFCYEKKMMHIGAAVLFT